MPRPISESQPIATDPSRGASRTRRRTPYADLPQRNFWRHAVAERDIAAPDLYRKKFEIGTATRIATAGSCFAQHIGRHLRASNAHFLDNEPAPPGLAPETAERFGYGLYSARYGNIYSAAQLRQLLDDARAGRVHRDAIWERDGRFFDALRPGVEPDGLATRAEVIAHRKQHLARVADLFGKTDLFVFTLGLTETWVHRRTGRVYPACPGVVAGRFDPTRHVLHTQTYPAVWRDMTEARRLLRRFNPGMKMLLTVSPVPLAATARDEHVLTATTHSKATLRAVAGDMAEAFDDVAYFPSFEMITATPFQSRWLAENFRSVTSEGVAHVMAAFFAAHPGLSPRDADKPGDAGDSGEGTATSGQVGTICEERMLEAFAP